MIRTATGILTLFLLLPSMLLSQQMKTNTLFSGTDYEDIFDGIVLLKNHGRLLPVNDSITSIALIGPTIHWPGLAGIIRHNEQKNDQLHHFSPYEGIALMAGDSIDIYTAEGINMYNDIIRLDSALVYKGQGVNGYSVRYYNNTEASGSPADFDTDKFIDHYWRSQPHPFLDTAYSVSWDATLIPPHGPVKVKLIHSDGCRLLLDGDLLIDSWEEGPVRADSAWLNIRKGQSYNLQVDFFSDGSGPAVIKLGFDYLESNMLFEAVEKAGKADMVVIVVGHTVKYQDDGFLQNNYHIPRQSKLIREIYEVNPNIVVVMQTSGPVNIESWAFDVPAIIQAGMPGVNNGKDIAKVLFGKKNPYGKLPYRWTMNQNQNYATRFPYGHGYSYSTIGIGKLMMYRKRDGSGWTATVETRNMGDRTGTEVLQLYLSKVNDHDRVPDTEMKACKAVTLFPGQRKVVSIPLPYEVFEYYDDASGQWVVDPGLYEIKVGVSAEDIKLRKTIEIKDEHIKR